SSTKSSRKLLMLAKPPSILSLPGLYCAASSTRDGILRRKRLRLYDRQAVVQSLVDRGLPQKDEITREPKRFMAIITAPVLFNAGRQVDRGLFCAGCMNETEEKTTHFRIKYTTQGMSEHIASYGLVVKTPRIPRRFMHVIKDRIKP
ncbi:hypothetical protein C0991_006131, partial [Blastosporella zonata]